MLACGRAHRRASLRALHSGHSAGIVRCAAIRRRTAGTRWEGDDARSSQSGVPSGNAGPSLALSPKRPEVAMQIPYPLAIALVAATYGFIAVGAWAM